MFDRLRSAFSSLVSAFTERTVSHEDVDDAVKRFAMALYESDVAHEVVEELQSKIRSELVGSVAPRSVKTPELVEEGLRSALKEILTAGGSIDLEGMIRSKPQGEPFVIVFLGINGTGKTTTIAKLAHALREKGFSVVLACADTHRAGAIEQLSEHASRLQVKVIAQKYGSDPAAVARDAVIYAKNHGINLVLVDTAGRMQTSRNLMQQMEKIVRVVRPDLKIFVGDALAGNDALSQAVEFMRYTDFSAAILTKADADAKGGAAVSVAFVTKRPIIYLGTGQGYRDLTPFKPDEMILNLLEGAHR